jgi:hypothetical protein
MKGLISAIKIHFLGKALIVLVFLILLGSVLVGSLLFNSLNHNHTGFNCASNPQQSTPNIPQSCSSKTYQNQTHGTGQANRDSQGEIVEPEQLSIPRQTAPTPTPKPPPVKINPTSRPTVPVPASPGQVAVIAMIEQVFGPHATAAIKVARCESGLNPLAYNPISIGGNHAVGLFQILYPSTWRSTSQASSSPYSAMANILAAHQIFVRDGYNWHEWSCPA